MKYKDIVYNIKDKNFEKIYLLYGKEHYLIDNAIKLFRESLNESMIDFNLETIDGKETTLDQLLSSIETLPFMDERKIVIVKDFELLTKSKKICKSFGKYSGHNYFSFCCIWRSR